VDQVYEYSFNGEDFTTETPSTNQQITRWLLEINTVVQLLQIEFHIHWHLYPKLLSNGDGNLDDGLQDVRTIIQIFLLSIFDDRYG
jgi:hypothetical protein